MTPSPAPTDVATRLYPTPVGDIVLQATAAGMRSALWAARHPTPESTGAADSSDAGPAHRILTAAASQLDEYFAGTRTSFDLPLDLQGTPFQRAAWRALAEIPYGETRSYAEQARRLGRPQAFRAVGAANGRNPLSIILPCHRVVGSNGALTGFAGGIEAKRLLLEHELDVAGRSRARALCAQVPSPGPVALGGEIAVP